MRTRTLVGAVVVLLASVAGVFAAQAVEYTGKVTVVETSRIQIEREGAARPRQVWVAVADDLRVVEGDRTMTFAAAKLKRNSLVTVAVVPFEGVPPREWSCTMHTHVAEAGPGKCPVCGMALTEREKAPAAKEIRITKR
jgi:hypothetical protein